LLDRQSRELKPLPSLNAQVDPLVGRIVARCLKVDPDERWQTAAELASALRKSLSFVGGLRRLRARHPLAARSFLALTLSFATLGTSAMGVREPLSVREIRKGQDALRRNRYDEAVKCFSQALEADSQALQGYLGRARAHHYLAVEYYDRIAEARQQAEKTRLHTQADVHFALASHD